MKLIKDVYENLLLSKILIFLRNAEENFCIQLRKHGVFFDDIDELNSYDPLPTANFIKENFVRVITHKLIQTQ